MNIISKFRIRPTELFTIYPNYAFTEMRAAIRYKECTMRPYIHLAYYSEDKIFDDCVRQEIGGFDMTALSKDEQIKKLYVRDGKFFGVRKGKEIGFASLNLSWVPLRLFAEIFSIVSHQYQGN